MKWKPNKKSIFWLIGVTSIGIGSNAIWEFLIRPVLLLAQNGILTLTTLGIQSFKDDIYREIARGHHDRASETIFILLMMLLMLAPIAIIFLGYTRFTSRRKQRLERIDTERNKTIDAKLAALEHVDARITKLIWMNVGVAVLLTIVSATLTVKTVYIGSAVTYYDQLMAIATPYLTDNKVKLIASEFAQIKNQDGYERIISELRSLAKMKGQSVPAFNIW